MKRQQTQGAATTPSHILPTSALNDPLQAVSFDDKDSITTPYGLDKSQGNDNTSTTTTTSSNRLRNSHFINNNSTSGDNSSSSEINPEHSGGAGTNPLLDHHPLSSDMTQVLHQQNVNHPLSHTAHHGHTLIGRDGDNDYHNAGDAVGDSGVNDDGSNVRRTTLSNEGASAGSRTGNNEHSRRGSKRDSGPSRHAVFNADTSSSLVISSADSTDTGTFTTEPSRTPPLSSIDSPADAEVLQVTLGRAVQPWDSLSLEERESDPPIQRRTSIVRQHVRARTISTPTPPRSKPFEYLSDMGPLEVSRKVDSGVHLGREYEREERVEEEEEPAATLGSSAPLPLDGKAPQSSTLDVASMGPASSRLTSYTHISESSQSSQSTAGGSSATTRTTDKEADEDGSIWKHPLLMDLTTEPESLDDDVSQNRGATPPPSYVQGRNAILHRKGYTMSAGFEHGTGHSPRETSGETQTSKLEDAQNSHAVKASDDDDDWTNVSHTGKDLSHGRTMTESEGKRVIIHQVSVTDTLAGIALYYGIQVSVLKKCNKLWTNDSIHTRKYLYIPFEECTVARQDGVMVDENSQTVILPQKVQHQQHGRSRTTWVDTGRSSTLDFVASSNNDGQNNLPAIDESSSEATTVASGSLPPLILPIAVPGASAVISTNSELLINSPRIRVDSKSTAAPAVSSPTMTAASLKSDGGLRAAPLSPRRAATTDSSSRRAPFPAGSAPFSENLPNTVVVQPSMTHEALAARFKEMDLVTSEQQQRKLLNQELRTNPVHQRHRTTDLRQLANIHHHQQQRNRVSLPPSTAGSRRTSVDIGASETSIVNSVAGPSGRRASGFDRQLRGESHLTIDEEDQPSDFVAYGNQQHIYEPDNLNRSGNLVGDRSEQRDEAESSVTVLRRQELVTLPAGMLSFFPSPEHSKRLETPEPISRLQSRMDSYHSSLSSSSTSSGSFRGVLQDKKDPNAKKKTRATLDEQTFQPPTPSAANSSSVGSSPQQHGPSESSSVARTAQSKTVRVHQSYYSAQKWSMMGESLVDDILGAVRGPLQIARRVYNNFTTMNFSAAVGSSFGKDSQDHFDPPSVRRRGSTRSRPRVGQRSTDYRQSSESVIELDRTEGMCFALKSSSVEPSTTTFADLGSNRYSSIARRVPTSPVAPTEAIDPEHNSDLNSNSNSTSPVPGQGQVSRRKSGSRGSTGHGHFRVSSSGSTHSTRKRSLRSANPINRAALMALVNEMERDTREKERDFVKEQEKTAQDINGNCDTSSIINNGSDDANYKGTKASTSPVVIDILATPL